MTIGRPKVGPYLFDHNVVVFKCGICGRMKFAKKSKRRRTSDYQGLQQLSGRKAPRSKSLRSRSICGSGGFYAATATWRGNTPEVAGEDAEDSRLEREFSEVRQMKGQRIAPSVQLDSIQNPNM